MAITELVAQLDREIARLQQARALLVEQDTGVHRPRVGIVRTTSAQPKRTLSPEARKKIADAQRARWAKVKSSKKS